MKPKNVINFCVADNILRLSPIECLSHVFGELLKTGNTFEFYTHLMYPQSKEITNFYALNSEYVTKEIQNTQSIIRQLGLGLSDKIKARYDLNYGVFYDSFNVGGPVSLYDFFRICINSGLIQGTEANVQLLEDHQFWASGKKSYGLKISMNGPQFPMN